MQARVDWVLIIFGTQVIKKKRPVRPVLPDYLSVSFDYDYRIKRKNQNKCYRARTLDRARVVTLMIALRNIYQIFRPITPFKHMLRTKQYVA